MIPPGIRHVRAGEVEPAAWHDAKRGDVRFRQLLDAGAAPAGGLAQGIAEFVPGGRENLHAHDIAESGFVLDGEGLLLLDGREVAVAAGDMLLVPPGTVHGWSTPETSMRLLFTFPAPSLDAVVYRWAHA